LSNEQSAVSNDELHGEGRRFIYPSFACAKR